MWQPISLDAIRSRIDDATALMDQPVLAFWERIRVRPVKWSLPPWGDHGGGFWVVAVLGQECIWYNDIEDGFNESPFEEFGRIREYLCDQTELHHRVAGCFERFMRAIAVDAEPS